jgi:hypothetical protein
MKFGIQVTDMEQGKVTSLTMEFDPFQQQTLIEGFIGRKTYDMMQEVHGPERISQASQEAQLSPGGWISPEARAALQSDS